MTITNIFETNTDLNLILTKQLKNLPEDFQYQVHAKMMENGEKSSTSKDALAKATHEVACAVFDSLELSEKNAVAAMVWDGAGKPENNDPNWGMNHAKDWEQSLNLLLSLSNIFSTFNLKPALSFQASWNKKNEHLRPLDGVIAKIARTILSPVNKLVMRLLLPASDRYSQTLIRNETKEFALRWQKTHDIHPIKVTTPDGVLLKGHFLQKKGLGKEAPLVIAFEPNAGASCFSSSEWLIRYAKEEQLEQNFLLFDYRGVGSSQGKAALIEHPLIDGDSIVQFAEEYLHVDPSKITFYGHSFGGAVAGLTKSIHPECTGVAMLDRTFSSLPAVLAHIKTQNVVFNVILKLGKLLFPLGLNKLQLDAALPQIQGKTLVTYHKNDQVIPNQASLAQSIDPNAQNIQVIALGHRRCVELGSCGTPVRVTRKYFGGEDVIKNAHGACFAQFATETRSLAKEKASQFLFYPHKASDAYWLDKFYKEKAHNSSLYLHPERMNCNFQLEQDRNKVYKTVAKLFQNGGWYFGSGEDAFHGKNGLSLSDAQKAEAIRLVWHKNIEE